MSSDTHKTVDDGSGNEISGKPPSLQAECDVGLALNMQHTHPSKKINLMSHPSPYHNHHPKYHQTSIEFGGGGRQIFEPSSNHIAFVTSPNYTTSGGVIFTASQLQELESQTMIYKHIMSSIPVPPQLLFPLSSQSNRSDSEPWRCRRTDGKKWRCSRDVMPDQKYCERHAHKNRARSRKHVETHQSQMQITQSHNSSKHLSSTKDNYNTILPHTPTMSPSCQQSSLLMKNGTIPLSSSNQKIQKPSVGSKGDHFFQNLGGRSSHDHDLVGDNCFLTLMQPGGNDNNNSDDQDDLFQLGFGMLNADDSNTHNQWTHQGSWLGGPLGEALCLGVASSLNKPSNVTSSLDLSHHGLH